MRQITCLRVSADYDPFLEDHQERQQPSCIPLSSALRFYTNLPSRKPPAGHTKVATTGAAHPPPPTSTAALGGGKAAPVTAVGPPPGLGRASSTGSASNSGQSPNSGQW